MALESAMSGVIKNLCVFCGSSRGEDARYAQAARELGSLMAERGLGLVYGGGRIGLMGEIASAVLEAGGEAVGVIPEALLRREVGHGALTRLEVVDSMHTRKARMADLADGFIAMPGGFGTFEEWFEIITWAQLGIHDKPCVLLNVAGYFDPLLELVERAVNEKFIRAKHRGLFAVAETPAKVLDCIAAFEPAGGEQWLSRSQS
ncbi:MAG TPA: TIGR00730 family Rossman fold protein [Gammaproteobacteria bacterium]